jgi:predicted RNase H-like HicB family nuclease
MLIELEREVDGRWIAEVPAIPGVIVYGSSPEQALNAARRLAADVTEDRRIRGEPVPEMDVGALKMVVGSHVAAVAPGEATSLLVGYVEGLLGAHTHAASLDELFLNISEAVGLVTENDSVPENLPEERLSTREN